MKEFLYLYILVIRYTGTVGIHTHEASHVHT
jgi:hypothetical protein